MASLLLLRKVFRLVAYTIEHKIYKRRDTRCFPFFSFLFPCRRQVERTNERNKIDGSIIVGEMTPERRRGTGRRSQRRYTATAGWSSSQLMGYVKGWVERRIYKKLKEGEEGNSLADAKSHFETPLQWCVFVEALKRLHAQVPVASPSRRCHGRYRRRRRRRPTAIAVAHKRIQVLAALTVRLTLGQRSMTGALIDGHGPTAA